MRGFCKGYSAWIREKCVSDERGLKKKGGMRRRLKSKFQIFSQSTTRRPFRMRHGQDLWKVVSSGWQRLSVRWQSGGCSHIASATRMLRGCFCPHYGWMSITGTMSLVCCNWPVASNWCYLSSCGCIDAVINQHFIALTLASVWQVTAAYRISWGGGSQNGSTGCHSATSAKLTEERCGNCFVTGPTFAFWVPCRDFLCVPRLI